MNKYVATFAAGVIVIIGVGTYFLLNSGDKDTSESNVVATDTELQNNTATDGSGETQKDTVEMPDMSLFFEDETDQFSFAYAIFSFSQAKGIESALEIVIDKDLTLEGIHTAQNGEARSLADLNAYLGNAVNNASAGLEGEELASFSTAYGEYLIVNISEIEIPINMELFADTYKKAIDGEDLGLSDDEAKMFLDEYITPFYEAYSAKVGERNLTDGEAFLAENANRPEIVVTDTGLQYEVLTEGTGEIPMDTDTVQVNYVGTFIDGTVFDSSTEGTPVEFSITGVIAGWTEALQLMPVGSKWKLYIPANLAYGESGSGSIEPNSTLVFEVELLNIVPQETIDNN